MNPDVGHLWDAIRDIADNQDRMAEGQAVQNQKLDGLIDVVGRPGTPDNGQPATGIFAHLNAHDARLKIFEKLWENGKGYAMGSAPLVIAIWWLVGDKVAKLFH